jgi:hypothetical protein
MKTPNIYGDTTCTGKVLEKRWRKVLSRSASVESIRYA